jgi:putative ABC transport system permease protein
MKAADEDYVSTFGLQLVAGRNLFHSDTVKEFLVNELLAKKLNLSSPQELIGKTITFNGGMKAPIVGVIKDFHDQSFHTDINPVAFLRGRTIQSICGKDQHAKCKNNIGCA